MQGAQLTARVEKLGLHLTLNLDQNIVCNAQVAQLSARVEQLGSDLGLNLILHSTLNIVCHAQVAQLSARVQQLTAHLQTHRKDFACRRGLVILLGQRRRLMQYLYKVNRCARAAIDLHARLCAS